MTRNEKIVAAAWAGFVGLSIYDYVRMMKAERAASQKVEERLDRDLMAISKARLIVGQKLKTGKYVGGTIGQMLDDFEKQCIIEATLD